MFVLVLSSFSFVEVRAETSEDLLNVYGMTLGGSDKLAIEYEINSLLKEIDGAEAAKADSIAKNTFTDLQKEFNKEKKDSLNKDLNSILDNNSKIVDYISDNFMSTDINDLLTKDKEYKNNVSKANNVLAELDILEGITYTYEQFDYDFEGMEELLSTKKVLYDEALDTYELGEVSNIRFPMNTDRYVTSKYGNRIDPIKKNVTSFHAGTDYRAVTGTEIYSMFNGVVTSCGWSDTSGYFIVVESGENVKTFVCHLSKILVEKGQSVKQYDLIGLSGGTGSRSTGPHLHLALYLNGATYDVDKLFN